MTNRENYNDLYLFMQVVREGSFTKAAAKLGVAQSGVSRTVRELEARLGVQLLNRTTRILALTQAGSRFFKELEESFEKLDNGLHMLAQMRDMPSGTVRINASQYAIDTILLPKLATFHRLYPDIRLELISESRFVDIVAEGFDAGVRLGSEVGEEMVAVKISEEMKMAVVATPEHFRRYGFPKTPPDLAAHPCIAYQLGNRGVAPWDLWYQGEPYLHHPQGQWAFAESYMETAAALRGLGAAYVPLGLVEDALERGDLIRVLKEHSHRYPSSYLYYPHRNVSRALRLVADSLRVG